jgi:uncharacterized protein YjbI with pentapeptide repeats
MKVPKIRGSVIYIGLAFGLGCQVLAYASESLKTPSYHAQNSDLSGRNFEGVNLSLADFTHSKLSGSSFRNANLNYANLSLADFSHTDLTNASLKFALIEFTNLTAAKGLSLEQLKEACVTELDSSAAQQLGFDLSSYQAPSACLLWEHVPRG